MWIAVGVLLVALVALQVLGTRALAGMGVQPSPAVVALRAVNVVRSSLSWRSRSGSG
jgi:hypothetical protein